MTAAGVTPAVLGDSVPMRLVPAKPMSWFQEGWLPNRHVTLVVAPPKTSKGILTWDWIGRGTTGRRRVGEPEGTTHEPRAAIIVAPEDDPNESLAYRAIGAKADTDLVFNLTRLADGSRFLLPEASLPGGALETAIKRIASPPKWVNGENVGGVGVPVGLVVIDPLLALVTRPINSDIAARAIVDPLEQLAKEYNLALALTQHTVKSGKTASSTGLVAAARMVLQLRRENPKDPKDPYRVLTVGESNVAEGGAALRYKLVGSGDEVRVVWAVEAQSVQGARNVRGYDIAPVAVPTVPQRRIQPVPAPVLPRSVARWPRARAGAAT